MNSKNKSKYKIVVQCEDEWEMNVIANAKKNKLALDTIYDEVFRPIIKYGTDLKEVEAFEMVWKKLSEHLNRD